MFDDALKQVAQEVVSANRAGDESATLKMVERLYADDVVSVEAVAMPDGSGGAVSRETHGIDGIKGKHAWWGSTFEVHSSSTSDPFFHGDDRFALIFEVDATERASGERSQMKEVGIYTVRDGKVVREEFYYTA